MRVPIPERFNLKYVILFGFLLFLGQQLVGTDLNFSLLSLLYVILFGVAFNVAGGLLYPSGSWIFFNGILTAIFGLTYKTVLGIPGEKFLLSPVKSMAVYCAGMFSMLVAAYLSRRLEPKIGLLEGVIPTATMLRVAVSCLVLGAFLQVTTQHAGGGSVGSALRLLNRFLQVALILATTYELRISNGERATNWVVWSSAGFIFFYGLLYFGKESMFTGITTWALTCLIMGYRFRVKHLIYNGIAVFFLFYYLVPFSQYARDFRTESRTENLAVAVKYLGNLSETRKLYVDEIETYEAGAEPHLYGTPQGMADRLNMLAWDDALIAKTDDTQVFGLLPTIYSYANIVPHFLWAGKPDFNYGNAFAHEIGLLSEEDSSTGISFGPTTDAYHEAGWFGVLVVLPLVLFLFFFSNNSLAGNARRSPLAVLPIVLVAHAAPEGLMQGTIFLTTWGVVILLVIAVFARYVLPIVSGVFSGAERARVHKALDLSTPLQPAFTAGKEPQR